MVLRVWFVVVFYGKVTTRFLSLNLLFDFVIKWVKTRSIASILDSDLSNLCKFNSLLY